MASRMSDHMRHRPKTYSEHVARCRSLLDVARRSHNWSRLLYGSSVGPLTDVAAVSPRFANCTDLSCGTDVVLHRLWLDPSASSHHTAT